MPIRVILLEIALICIILHLAIPVIALLSNLMFLVAAVLFWLVVAGIVIAALIYAGPFIALGIVLIPFFSWLFSFSWKNNQDLGTRISHDNSPCKPENSIKDRRSNSLLNIILLIYFVLILLLFTWVLSSS